MKALFLAASLATAPAPASVPAPTLEPLLGVWRTDKGAAEIQLIDCGGVLCGKLLNARKIQANPALEDFKNHDPDLRHRLVKGLTILTGFKGGPTEWRGGKVYNPDDGGTYRGVMRLVDEVTLKVTGCIVWPLCKSTSLTRID
jgi:uncharacterized protein (DUF2147 family)